MASFQNNSLPSNNTTKNDSIHIPLDADMVFSEANVIKIATLSCLFIISAIGNMTIFVTLWRNRHRKSRVNLLIMHLAVADLMVTFIMMPLEIIWAATVSWRAGDLICRIMAFFRSFGLYLSSFVLIAISLDRYFAILHPLSLNDADRRGKFMLAFAWILSIICSVPQSIIFHVDRHYIHTWYFQCVTFNFFPSPAHELTYNMFVMIVMYGLPLLVIIGAYSIILWKISKKSRESKVETSGADGKRLRRSGVGNIEKARAKTLRMTIIIVFVFILCWTPYYVMALWYWFDFESAKKVDQRIEKGLFLFAVSNSCMNPIVYGIFSLRMKKELRKCCPCFRKSEQYSDSWASRSCYRSTVKSKLSYGESNSTAPVNNKLISQPDLIGNTLKPSQNTELKVYKVDASGSTSVCSAEDYLDKSCGDLI